MYQNIYYQREKNLIHLWDDGRGYLTFPYKRYAYKKAKHGEYESIHGDRLTKIYKFRRDDPGLFESDVAETTRVLVDLYTESDEPSEGHCILTYDIEVEMDSGAPDPKEGKNQITSIALHDSVSNHYWVLVMDNDGVLEKYTNDKQTVIPFGDERDLLEHYLNLYQEINPTIVTGWSIDFFDTPYLFNRIKRVMGEHNAKRLSPIGEVFFSPYRNRYFIAGVSYLDYLTLYKNFNYSELDNYRLDTIAFKELKRGKIEYKGKLDELFRTDIDKFIEYNLVDVELVVGLDNKLQFIDLARGICHAGRVPYEDFVYSSKYLEGALLAYLKQRNLVAPNKPADRQERMESLRENKQEKFLGAYVKDPIVGKYSWVYDLDLTSLYPSIIMSLNISPETKVGKIEDWNAEEYMRGTKTVFQIGDNQIDSDSIKEMLENENYSISSNGVLYNQGKVGCIPDILDLWFSRRVEFRKLESQYGKSGDKDKYNFYKKRQLVQKILLNSLYGVLGLPAFRFYDVDNAVAVTSTGQTVIKNTARMGNLKYNKELGGVPLEIKFSSGKSRILWPNNEVKVNGKVIRCSELKVGDVATNDDVVSKITPQEGLIPTEEIGGQLDHNIYIDTDSVFFSAEPILDVRWPHWREKDEAEIAKLVDTIAGEMQEYLNEFYHMLAKRFFNLDKHRFEVKKEFVAKSGLWVAKKRYAQWIIMENGVPVERLDVKGLDVVRSSFPAAFRKLMSEVLIDILKGKSEVEVSERINNFKSNLSNLSINDIAKNSAVKEVSKYQVSKRDDNAMFTFKKSTPAHVKASLAYNKLLKHFSVAYKYAPIRDGDKIKWVYLTNNPYGLNGVGFNGYNDPKEITDFIEQYIDYDKIFETELVNKLQDFYTSLGWGDVINSQRKATKFFDF